MAASCMDRGDRGGGGGKALYLQLFIVYEEKEDTWGEQRMDRQIIVQQTADFPTFMWGLLRP